MTLRSTETRNRAMSAKDYVYLSLILLSAVVFYWTGFYGGFSSTLRELKRREDVLNRIQDLEIVPEPPLLVPVNAERHSSLSARRGNRPVLANAGIQGMPFPESKVYFGRN